MKLWDPRRKESIRTYKHHFDYITDFLWLQDAKHLVATSGDGTLSVLDVRSKSSVPFAHSEDQEDELLSLVSIKGHPHSVDALCSLPSTLPNVDSTSMILTGSSDGFLRAVNIFPTKLHGVVADHGEWPVERIAVGGGTSQLTLNDGDDSSEPKDESKVGSHTEDEENREVEDSSITGLWWAGSVGHDEVLKLTDLGAFFSKGPGGADDEEVEGGYSDEDSDDSPPDKNDDVVADGEDAEEQDADRESDSDDQDAGECRQKKRKRKDKDPLLVRKRKAKNEVEIEGAFFDDL
ncbi:hypothetical protein AAF712_011486 [Marasmius tenuissimus]|uniref:WD repeat-containing protein JIP5 n=1 Tax=Marasmius tenuissimus TaxID=585030 RepID=A0ABR2ZJ65_9AGAR